MNPNTNAEASRHKRLATLLQQDPENALLLADAMDAAIQEADFDAAERHLVAGLRAEGQTAGWRYREATLRIAQRRLVEAKGLLGSLVAGGQPMAAVEHNLAYVEFLGGDHASCVEILLPWVTGKVPADATVMPAIETLWLRAMHHLDRLNEAWRWIEHKGTTRLAPVTAGVASLIAIDLNHMDMAGALAVIALEQDASHPEACIAAASRSLSRRETAEARSLLLRVTKEHPHQARAWLTFGFVELADSRLSEALSHFERAVSLSANDSMGWIGMGWTQVLKGDLEAAKSAFSRAVGIDPESADAHGALASVLALQGERSAAADHAEHARKLQPGSMSARFADSVLRGDAGGLAAMQRIARQLLEKG